MRQGFSLIELSIGLVIIGLITGGILTGQSLLRNSEIKSVISEAEKFITATNIFRNKYDGLPGDYINATATWGVAHATPATCAITQGTGTQTCDGNDNGLLEPEHVNPNSAETFRFWQHLANANLIEGSFTGIKGSAGNWDHTIPGVNAPRATISNGGWAMRWIATGAFTDNENTLIIGAITANTVPQGLLFKPEDAWNIDAKTDDGRPAFGKVRALHNAAPCTTTAVAATAEYALSNSAAGCAIGYINFIPE